MSTPEQLLTPITNVETDLEMLRWATQLHDLATQSEVQQRLRDMHLIGTLGRHAVNVETSCANLMKARDKMHESGGQSSFFVTPSEGSESGKLLGMASFAQGHELHNQFLPMPPKVAGWIPGMTL